MSRLELIDKTIWFERFFLGGRRTTLIKSTVKYSNIWYLGNQFIYRDGSWGKFET